MASYVQVRKPNTSVKGYSGWCLNYARRVFGVGAKYPTAWAAWKNASKRHTLSHPKNVAVPIWFSFYRAGVNFGHVVVYVPGKGYYSSPYKSGTTHAVLSSIAEVQRIYSCKYVGWTEDINGVAVVKRDPRQYKIVGDREHVRSIAKRAGYEDWDKESRWTFIAKLNGYSTWRAFNQGVEEGQRVRVR